MQKDMSALITNNIVAIAVHVCMCIAFIFPLLFLYGAGSWGDDILVWFTVGIYTIVALFLYFFAGKSLLGNTQNILINVFSVIGLPVILLAPMFVASDIRWESLLTMPVYPIGGAISFFFQIEEKYCYLAISFLPSLAMLAGLMTKRQEDDSILNTEMKKLFLNYLIVLFGLISFLITFLIGVSVLESGFIYLITFLLLFCFNVIFLIKKPFFYVFSESNTLTKTLRISFLLYLSIIFSILSIIFADIILYEAVYPLIISQNPNFQELLDYPNFPELLNLFVSAILNIALLKILNVLFLNSANRRIENRMF